MFYVASHVCTHGSTALWIKQQTQNFAHVIKNVLYEQKSELVTNQWKAMFVKIAEERWIWSAEKNIQSEIFQTEI